jgi:4-hydroxy-tetrahydrodipicolinate synthase
LTTFQGLVPPVITPMRDGRVDAEGIDRFVAHAGELLDGMVVCGSCGEGPSLPADEKRVAVEAFVGAADGRFPIVLGAAGTSVADVITTLRMGEELGVAGFLVPSPMYFRNSSQSVAEFFRSVAAATDLEVMVYDNPSASKTVLSVEDLVRIVEASPNINHVKMTDTDLEKVEGLVTRSDVTVLAGSDEIMHHQLMRGCPGAVTAAPQVFPRTGRAWFDAASKGDEKTSREHYNRMAPFIIELLQGPDQYPAVIKFALGHLGVLPSDEVLPPLTPLSQRRRAEVATVLDLHALD